MSSHDCVVQQQQLQLQHSGRFKLMAYLMKLLKDREFYEIRLIECVMQQHRRFSIKQQKLMIT